MPRCAVSVWAALVDLCLSADRNPHSKYSVLLDLKSQFCCFQQQNMKNMFLSARILAEKLKEGCEAAEALKDLGCRKRLLPAF